MIHRIPFAVLLFVCTGAISAQAQTTALFFDSQAGDYIGQGQQRTWTPAELTFSVSSSSPSSITLSATNFTASPFVWWYLDFRAPEGTTLTPGSYDRAERASFRAAPLSGLDVSGSGRGCNVLSGRFVIHEIMVSGTTLTRFAADFEQHCEGAAAALFGSIRYNSTRSSLAPFDGNYPSYSLTVSPPVNGYVTGTGIDCGAGRFDCDETFLASTVVGLTPVASAGFVFLGWAGDCFGTTAAVTVDRPRVCVPVFNSAAGTGIETPSYALGAIFVDQPGSSDYDRQRVVHLASLAEITVTPRYNGITVNLDGMLYVDEHFDFAAPAGFTLVPGDYPYAEGVGSARGGAPGLETSYCGSGGRFRIYELTYSGTDIASFAADLEQRCGTGAETLVVAIRYRAARASLLPFDGHYPLNRIGVHAGTGGRVWAAGIACGGGSADCEETFTTATSLTLQALPSPGYEFLAWSGDCSGSDASAVIVVDRTRQCSAYFQPTVPSANPVDPSFGAGTLFRYQPGATSGQRRVWTLRDASFTLQQSQSRRVTIDADGAYGRTSLTIAAPVSGGTLVPGYYEEAYPSPNARFPELTASSCNATSGRFRIYEFATGSSGQVLTFAADFELQCATGGPLYGAVRFNALRSTIRPFGGAFPVYTLSLTPSTRGRVTGTGIDCGAGNTDCSESYATATSVSLTAAPTGSNIFLGWRGACDGPASTTVIVSGPSRCAAMFVSRYGTAATEDPSLSQGALLIDSEAGDPVGGGRRHIWSADAEVSATAWSRNTIFLYITQPDGGRWRLEFRAPSGSDLTARVYENAIYPSSSSPSPGLQVSSPANSSCYPLTGRFQIHEIAFDVDTYGSFTLARFAADFEQHCNGAAGSLRGAVRFKSSRPDLIPFDDTAIANHNGIVLGLSAYADGGWIATRTGASANYAAMPWARLPWSAYNASGRGVRVAAGDVDGDGLDEIVVGVEQGGNGWLAVLDDGAHNFALLKWIQIPWAAYNASNGSVWPAVGNIDGDARAEIVVSLGAGSQGFFAIFDDAAGGFPFVTWRQVNWPAYDAGGNGSTRPAIGNVDGTGEGEIIMGLGPGSHGWIEVFSGSSSGYAHRSWLQIPWDAYNAANGETFVSAGDLDGDGNAEIVAGLGVGGAGYLHIFDDAATGFAGYAWRRTSWIEYADDPARGQIYPAVGDVDGDGRAEIVLGFSPHPVGGWFEILNDNGADNALVGWRNVGWQAFAAAGGGVLPAVGRFW